MVAAGHKVLVKWIEQSEAVEMDIRNLEENIREEAFDRPAQLLALKNLLDLYRRVAKELHVTIALFE
jgi:hypothetical protein